MEKLIARQADKVMKHMANNENVIRVFLDIQAVFDTIQLLAIKQALHNHNLNDKLVDWYFSFLTHRHLITEHNGVTYEGNIGIGFPQGGVCSAKFWRIAFNEAMGFADDCCILLHRKHINHAMGLIQQIVDQLVPWGGAIGLTNIQPHKNCLHTIHKIHRQNT